MANWTAIDFAYSGIGSSELVNWARAVMVLNPMGDHDFELKMAKRGGRAGAKHPDGTFTTSVFLKHGTDSIRWHQQPPPEVTAEPQERKLTKPEQIAALNLGTFLSHCAKEGEGLRAITRRLVTWLGSKDCSKRSLGSCSDKTIRDGIALLLDNQKLSVKDGLYFKGEQA